MDSNNDTDYVNVVETMFTNFRFHSSISQASSDNLK